MPDPQILQRKYNANHPVATLLQLGPPFLLQKASKWYHAVQKQGIRQVILASSTNLERFIYGH
ncbi:MAG TPA: hypothetical protein DIS90_04120 [Cytophagales bacterium]|nr:hypothetical protein [Cytophagales bacterium]